MTSHNTFSVRDLSAMSLGAALAVLASAETAMAGVTISSLPSFSNIQFSGAGSPPQDDVLGGTFFAQGNTITEMRFQPFVGNPSHTTYFIVTPVLGTGEPDLTVGNELYLSTETLTAGSWTKSFATPIPVTPGTEYFVGFANAFYGPVTTIQSYSLGFALDVGGTDFGSLWSYANNGPWAENTDFDIAAEMCRFGLM